MLVSACIFAALVSGCSLRADEPEGSEMLFVREEGKRAAIYLMSHDGGQVRRLVEGKAARWSPDGTRFAYLVDEDEDRRYGGTSLWVMNPDTGGRRRVVSGNRDVGIYSFAWAPDGVRLAYTDGSQVFVVNTKTGDAELISIDVALDGPMDWFPGRSGAHRFHNLLVEDPGRPEWRRA